MRERELFRCAERGLAKGEPQLGLHVRAPLRCVGVRTTLAAAKPEEVAEDVLELAEDIAGVLEPAAASLEACVTWWRGRRRRQ